jgi:hypothetical protein
MQEFDLSNAARPDLTRLSGVQKARYEKLECALELRWNGRPPRVIKKLYGLTRQELDYYEERFFAPNEDGRAWGFRALVSGARVGGYTRTSESSASTIKDGFGAAGSFEQCLRTYPAARKAMEKAIKNKSKQPGSIALDCAEVHEAFLGALREADLPLTQYPLCTKTQGYESVRRYALDFVRRRKQPGERRSLFGPMANDGMDGSTGQSSWLAPMLPCDVVCYDEQQLPAIASVVLEHEGQRLVLPMERLSLCLLASVQPKCILGYNLSLRSRVSTSDFLEAMSNFLTPWVPWTFKALPELSYRKGAGFPNGVVPGFKEGMRIGLLRIDNDLTHFGDAVLLYMKRLLGLNIEFGKVRRWITRAAVEQTFSELQQHISKLPSTTGSGPQDRHVHDAVANAVKWEVTLDVLKELVEVIIANFNGLPRTELYGATPLEKVAKEFAGVATYGAALPGYAPEVTSELPLPTGMCKVVVRGSEAKGVAPYVELDHAKYSSELLRECWHHIGDPLIALLQKDHRILKLTYPDGRALCTVQVTGHWSESFHDQATRKEIIRLRKEGKIRYNSLDDPIEVFKAHKLAELAARAKDKPPKVVRGNNKFLNTLTAPGTPGRPPGANENNKVASAAGRWTKSRRAAQGDGS